MNSQRPTKSEEQLGVITARSSIWSTSSNLIGRLIAFAATAVLARLLDPEDFGIVAIGMISIGLLDAFRNFGVGDALIYRQRQGDTDSDTGFWIAIATGTGLTIAAWGFAPYVATFFSNAEAKNVVVALATVFFIESIGVIHAARAQRDFQFIKRASAELAKAVTKGCASIAFAILDFGYWSLVYGQITGTLIGVATYWILVDWRPRLQFSTGAGRKLLRYGAILILINFLGFAISRMDQIIVGRQFDAVQLGYYAVGFTLADLLVANLARTVGLAAYPAFSKLKNEPGMLTKTFLDTLFFIGLFSFGLGIGLYIVADSLVHVIYTEKWLPAVPVIRAIAVFSILHAISYTVGDLLKATGRPKYITYAQATWLLLGAPLYLYFSAWGIEAVAWCVVAMQGCSAAIMFTIFCRTTKVTVTQLIYVLAPASVAGLIMYITLTGLNELVIDRWQPGAMLVVDIFVGAAVFVATVHWLRPDTIMKVRTVFQKAS